MKKYLLIGLVLTGALPGFGQGRDTVFAVHKLFRQKRGSATGLLAAADSAFSSTRYVQLDASRSANVEKKPDVVGSAAFYLAGTLQASRYSAENEAFIIRRYREGEAIPPDIRRKLKRKHFRRTKQDVLSSR